MMGVWQNTGGAADGIGKAASEFADGLPQTRNGPKPAAAVIGPIGQSEGTRRPACRRTPR
jgi:hypothetical protein